MVSVFLTVVLTFAAAATAVHGSQTYRLVRQQAECLGAVAGCPAAGTDGLLNFVYGEKVEPLSGSFRAVYQPDGSVQFTVTSNSKKVLLSSKIIVGNGQPGCQASGTDNIELSSIKFNECGFTQEFDGQNIHRSIVVQIRHRFEVCPNSLVDFIGYRNVRVHFYLTLNQPGDDVKQPVIPVKNENVQICSELNHTIKALDPWTPNRWRFEVAASNYDPKTIGVGFKLVTCTLYYVLKSTNAISRLPEHNKDIIQNGKLAQSYLLDSTLPVRVREHGKSYEFLIGAGYLLDDNINQEKPPQIECTVCLCNLDLSSADSCPEETPIDASRSAFNLPLVFPENSRSSVLKAGRAKMVSAKYLK